MHFNVKRLSITGLYANDSSLFFAVFFIYLLGWCLITCLTFSRREKWEALSWIKPRMALGLWCLLYSAAAQFREAFRPLDLCCKEIPFPPDLPPQNPPIVGLSKCVVSFDDLVQPCTWVQFETFFFFVSFSCVSCSVLFHRVAKWSLNYSLPFHFLPVWTREWGFS